MKLIPRRRRRLLPSLRVAVTAASAALGVAGRVVALADSWSLLLSTAADVIWRRRCDCSGGFDLRHVVNESLERQLRHLHVLFQRVTDAQVRLVLVEALRYNFVDVSLRLLADVSACDVCQSVWDVFR